MVPRRTIRSGLRPRKVNAAEVTSAEGETERYLFYRGVGNFSAPLSVVADRQHDRFDLHARFEEVLKPGQTAKINRFWLVHILADGRIAYRAGGPITVEADRKPVVAQTRASFDAKDFAATNLSNLQQNMQETLVDDGLDADEAAALINTWNQAYFRTAGLRLFFLVPQVWTGHYLPLKVSVPAEIHRVMVGRIELESPEQRKLLDTLAKIATPHAEWLFKVKNVDAIKRLAAGRSDFGDLGVKIPDDYQAYLDLGRFRNALVVNREQQHPTPALGQFIFAYGLGR